MLRKKWLGLKCVIFVMCWLVMMVGSVNQVCGEPVQGFLPVEEGFFYSSPPYSKLTKTYITSEGNFKVHYTTTGDHATTLQYVQDVGAALENSKSVIEGFNMSRPGIFSSGKKVDVWVYNCRKGGQWLESKSEIYVDNDDLSNADSNLRKVIPAHELFHGIQ